MNSWPVKGLADQPLATYSSMFTKNQWICHYQRPDDKTILELVTMASQQLILGFILPVIDEEARTKQEIRRELEFDFQQELFSFMVDLRTRPGTSSLESMMRESQQCASRPIAKDLPPCAKIASRVRRVYEVGVSFSGRTYAEGKKINWKDGFEAVYVIGKYSPVLRRSQRG